MKPPAKNYVYHPSFDSPDAWDTIVVDMPGLDDFLEAKAAIKARSKRGPPGEPCHDYWPVLSREQEAHMFRLMNFLRHKAAEGHAECGKRADEAQAFLLAANFRLAVHVAKKIAQPRERIEDVLSEVNLTLMHAVKRFDFSRGFKFSTYATWSALRNNSARLQAGRSVVATEAADEAAGVPDGRASESEEARLGAEHDAAFVRGVLEYMEPKDRLALSRSAGIGCEKEPFEAVGARLRCTKEWARQIAIGARKKFRAIALEAGACREEE